MSTRRSARASATQHKPSPQVGCPSCREPDDGGFMVGCETCDEWFHGRCVDMTKKKADALTRAQQPYTCAQCTAKASSAAGLRVSTTTTTSTTTMETSPPIPGTPQSPPLSALGPQNDAARRRKLIAPREQQPPPQEASDDGSSDDAEMADSSDGSTADGTSSAQEDDEDERGPHEGQEADRSSKKARARAQLQHDRRAREARTRRATIPERRTSATTAAAAAAFHQRPRSAAGPALLVNGGEVEAARKKITAGLVLQLQVLWKAFLASAAADDAAARVVEAGESGAQLFEEIEAQLFAHVSGQSPARAEPGELLGRYRTRARSLLWNLKSNAALRESVFSGRVDAARLARMTPEEMSDETVRRQREQVLATAIERSVRTVDARQEAMDEFRKHVGTNAHNSAQSSLDGAVGGAAANGEVLASTFTTILEPPPSQRPIVLPEAAEPATELADEPAAAAAAPSPSLQSIVHDLQQSREMDTTDKKADDLSMPPAAPLMVVAAPSPLWTGLLTFEGGGSFALEACQMPVGIQFPAAPGSLEEVLPSQLLCTGRLPRDKAEPYLRSEMQGAPVQNKTILCLQLRLARASGDASVARDRWEELAAAMHAQKRWGVVANKYACVKEMYLVPYGGNEGGAESGRLLALLRGLGVSTAQGGIDPLFGAARGLFALLVAYRAPVEAAWELGTGKPLPK